MTTPEVGGIAIHQMYRKCVEEIGDSRQYGEYWGKRKAMVCTMAFLIIIHYFATPARLSVTLYVDGSSSFELLTQSASVPSNQI